MNLILFIPTVILIILITFGIYFKVFSSGIFHPIKPFEPRGITPRTASVLEMMKPYEYRGKCIYVIDDIYEFDVSLKKYINSNVDYGGAYQLNQYIKDELRNKRAFSIFLDGKQYVAIVPVENMDADDLIY